ncbi:Sporulation-specific protein spo7 [Lachnellula suecica]|uniref:Sporulation-specific protein spo7 n=1 Tax=Lachnellula suecica TaxID=602035 RepID=A0A8T9C8S6_9HELO|nr:Sporulation-specific protein spo7 [Lachnellula suecica]
MSNLDQLVKGAPPPGKTYDVPSTTPVISTESPTPPSVPDPLASLPSSPPQIYLNLLILEASLRAQWLQLRTRRRQHTFFLMLLGLWNLYFGYALFLKPREDGSGVGGSVYWVVEVVEKVCLMGGIFTGILIWVTGQWERGVRYPRRWVYTTNRGLRGFNCKLVVIKQHWWRDILSTLGFLFSYGLFSGNSGTSYRFVDHILLKESEKGQRNGGGHHALPNINENDETGHEEDLADGGDYVQLLLLPKPFSPAFRENWDTYRSEYWEKENERRAILRKKIKEQDRKAAKEQGGWFWWTGYRGWNRGKTPDVEKIHHAVHRHGGVDKRPRSGSVRSGSHSRTSSRSTTPTAEKEDPTSGRVRRDSNASDRRRKKPTGSRVQKLTPAGSRTATPEVHSPLARENSVTSVSSVDSERSGAPAGDGDSIRSLKPKPSPSKKSGSLRAAKQT